MTNRKIISAACNEKRPLNVWLSTNCMPGRASSARISIARRPAATKKKIVVTRYWIPITLWVGLVRQGGRPSRGRAPQQERSPPPSGRAAGPLGGGCEPESGPAGGGRDSCRINPAHKVIGIQ